MVYDEQDDIFEEGLDEQDQTTQLWKEYEEGRAYQQKVGMTTDIPKYVDFYEGRQWPAVTDETKLLPRPVFNVVKMIVRSKRASILSTPVRLVYTADDETIDATKVDKFNKFADYIQKEIGQSELDAQAIFNGAVEGTYIFHYYWDTEAKGKRGNKEGGYRCELIDVLNVFFANPKERDEQKQKWIIISSREEVSSVRAKADEDVDKESIHADESDERYFNKEQEGSKLVTVLTKYFRQNGEVFCMKATKSAIINKPFSITPYVDETKFDESDAIDAPNNNLTDKADENKTPTYRAGLYPIVVGNYEPRKKSIYGLSEVEGIVPNQKAINFIFAMQMLDVQNTAWGKYIVRKDALKNQQITNAPGQTLTDYSADGNGIRRLETPTFTSMPLNLANAFLDITRVVTGSTEVMTGETLSGQMSGAAIAQLQSQAQLPIEELQDRFWAVKEKQGKVLEQAFKLYYEKKDFSFESPTEKDDKGQPIVKHEMFNGSDYQNTEFSVVVEATAGTKASAAGDITMLDSLFAAQAIDIETYVDCYPDNAVSNKTKLKEALRVKQESELAQLASQLAEREQQLAQAAEIITKQKETVDQAVQAVQENERLKNIIVQLYGEASRKIIEANTNAKVAESDASFFAKLIGDELGITSTPTNITKSPAKAVK